MALPSCSSGKSWVRTPAGSPLGRHSRPPFLNSPTFSFFLVSTLITGSAAALMGLDLLVDVTELRVPVRVPLPSMVLALPCRLNPSSRSRSPTVSAPTLWPWRVSSPASVRVDLVVHRSGDIGSPRSSGSTSASSAGRSPGSSVGRPLAPPARPPRPAQRLRPGFQLIDAQRHRGLADPGGPGHQPDPAMPQRPGLRPHQQPPLPLIQMREDRLELRRQHPCRFLVAAHTTSACRIPGSYGLFFGKLLA